MMVTTDPYDVRQSVTQMHCDYQMMFWLYLEMAAIYKETYI